MANKNECYLCGGKLRGGYCPACGLDNTKIHRKHYHLNESYTVESMNGDAGQASEKCGYKAEQDTGSFETEKKEKKSKPVFKYNAQFQNTKFGNNGRNTAWNAHSSGKSKIAVAVIISVFVLMGGVANYISENGLHFGGLSEPEADPGYAGPYEYAKRELAETGDHYETELIQGEYLVGVHLPEGSYTAELLEGSGGLSLEDMENGIYIWQSFGTEEEYDEVQVLEDIRLYEGAHVTVRDPVILKLTTENGQTDDLEFTENPLTETVTVKKDETLTVGDEIVQGVYDLHVESGWGILRCMIIDEDYEDGYYETSYWLSGEEMDDTYRNLYLREGTVVTAEENSLELVPSEVIGTGDYWEYYQYD